MRFKANDFNVRNYESNWSSLNKIFRQIEAAEGLPAVLAALNQQQLDIGFIQDDLRSVIRCRVCHPRNPSRTFTIQYNPKRAERSKGAGRTFPPPGSEATNDGCFLDPANIRWQQRGLELGFDLEINGTEYIAWMNPFPLMGIHTTIAKRTHEPQSWVAGSIGDSEKRIRAILADLLDLTCRLPGYIGFYNGEGAGASIPRHFHFQFFKRPEGQQPFALEEAASHIKLNPTVIGGDDYPITTVYFRGPSDRVLELATRWVHGWTSFYDNNPALSANIIATLDDDDASKFHLYFVPRNRVFSHAPGMVGLVGGLEVFGELVFSMELEKQHLDMARVTYQYVEQILAAVEAPGVREFVKMPYLPMGVNR
jgi:hypothetical protein